jgi:prepilin-type N-terminal cleavage/methylation domain-containing protein
MTTARGSTLLELIVVLAVMGTLAAITALALPGRPGARGPTQIERLMLARDSAIRTGLPVEAMVDTSAEGAPRIVRFLPDGRAVGPLVDPLTGAVDNAVR